MEEDKQLILSSLCDTLQKTRKFDNLIKIDYIKRENIEYAILYFPNGKKHINITGDSGYAMIQDILK